MRNTYRKPDTVRHSHPYIIYEKQESAQFQEKVVRNCNRCNTFFEKEKSCKLLILQGFTAILRRAIDGVRTRGLNLGKVARYQLRHYRTYSLVRYNNNDFILYPNSCQPFFEFFSAVSKSSFSFFKQY